MPDPVGYRIKFGVIVPSTNTVVEADYNRMAPPGVTLKSLSCGRAIVTTRSWRPLRAGSEDRDP